MGKCPNAVFPKVRVRTCYISQDIGTSGHSRRHVCSFDPMTYPSGHSRAYEAKFVFVLTFYRIDIERREWPHYDSPAKKRWLMCNMTYLAQHLTSRDLDIDLDLDKSDIDLSRSICTYFDASWREMHYAAKILPLAFLVQSNLRKKKTF